MQNLRLHPGPIASESAVLAGTWGSGSTAEFEKGRSSQRAGRAVLVAGAWWLVIIALGPGCWLTLELLNSPVGAPRAFVPRPCFSLEWGALWFSPRWGWTPLFLAWGRGAFLSTFPAKVVKSGGYRGL